MVRMVVGVSLAGLLLLMVLMQPAATAIAPPPSRVHMIPTVKVRSANALLNQLKLNNLWDVEASTEVPAVLINRLPADFNTLDQQTQKKAFLHTLLPVAMVALDEVENERQALEQVLGKFDVLPQRFDFRGTASMDDAAFARLNNDDVSLLQHLCEKYQTFDVETLRNRINPVPVSLILAQGALESAWGSSRLALEGNNLFGVGAWGGNDLGVSGKDRNKPAAYATLLDAVRAYILMLNRVPAYDNFRERREQTMDSLALAHGLRFYSERREDYVADVTRLIRGNQLQAYDRCELADTSFLKAGKQPRLNLASLR